MPPDHAVALKRAKRLAQRCAGHAELVGQVALRWQPDALRETAVGNVAAEPRHRIEIAVHLF